MTPEDRKAWDDLVAACEARGLSPWRAGMHVGYDVGGHFPATDWLIGDGSVTHGGRWIADLGATPDAQHPATLGVLLGLAREVWGDPTLYSAPDSFTGRWGVWQQSARPDRVVTKTAPTEFVALCRAIVAGLERAP